MKQRPVVTALMLTDIGFSEYVNPRVHASDMRARFHREAAGQPHRPSHGAMYMRGFVCIPEAPAADILVW